MYQSRPLKKRSMTMICKRTGLALFCIIAFSVSCGGGGDGGSSASNINSGGGDPIAAVADSTMTPAEGSFSSDQSVLLSTTTDGATIYYTTDGTTPTYDSTQYSDPIAVTGDGTTVTIKAFAAKTGMTDSAVVSGTYVIDYSKVVTVVPDILSGTYSVPQNVVLSTSTDGADIYYTTDGTTPTQDSTLYVNPIRIEGDNTTTVVKAIAIKDGMKDSDVMTETYILDYSRVSDVEAVPQAGSYAENKNVVLSTDEGATIYYTTDGSDPTTDSDVYSTSISVYCNGGIIKALATKEYMKDSNILTSEYTMTCPSLSPVNAFSANSPNRAVFNKVAKIGDYIYAVGTVYGNQAYDFGNGVAVTGSAGSSDNAVIVKYDQAGTAIWARSTAAGTQESSFNGVAGNSSIIYAAGYVYGDGEFQFGTCHVTGLINGDSTAILVAYDLDGNCITTKMPTTVAGGTKFTGVAVNELSGFVVGNAHEAGTFDFGNDASFDTNYAGGYNGFVVVYRLTDGYGLFGSSFSVAPNESKFLSVATTSTSSRAAIVGYITGDNQYTLPRESGDFDLTAPAGANLSPIVITVNASDFEGAATTDSGASNSEFKDVTMIGDYIYAAGYIEASEYNFGWSITTTGAYGSGINSVLVKYDTLTLEPKWAKSTTVANNESSYLSVTGDENGIYVSGRVLGDDQYAFDAAHLVTAESTTTTNYHPILVKYNSAGVAQSANALVSSTSLDEFEYSGIVLGDDYLFTAGYVYPGAYDLGYGITRVVPGSYKNLVLGKYTR